MANTVFFRRILSVVLLISVSSQLNAQSTDLPTAESSLFTGSGNCAFCHISNGIALTDSHGTDLSIPTDWRATMLANAARDPFWQAEVESEVKVNPQLKSVIEDKCITCHAPMARTQAKYDNIADYGLEQALDDPLGRDGVSCTVCHQVQPENLGLDESYSGGYIINDSRTIYGPYQNVLAGMMKNIVNYTPVFGAHIDKSELCASCHTLFTPYLDNNGQIAGTFPEQTAYFEWQNSVFSQQEQHCQDCHMQQIDESIVISNIPPSLSGHAPFGRHTFIGGNAFMLRILRDNGETIGVTATAAQFDTTIARTQSLLQNSTARLTLVPEVQNGQLQLTIGIENLAGHKFPTGFPSRRAWLHVLVQNAAGETLFESGGFDENGQITGLQADFEPHHQTITQSSEVQIYESVMEDVDGELTFVLLRGAQYRKDNRIPPKGFMDTHDRIADIAILGQAANDPDFNRDGGTEGTGSDQVHYLIDIAGQSGKLILTAELLYQSVNPSFVDHLLEFESPAITRFSGYFNEADKTPELVNRVVTEMNIITSVENDANNRQPADFMLDQNYPNPFNAGTLLRYSVAAETARLTVQIFDIQGHAVRTLVDRRHEIGSYAVRWDGLDRLGKPAGSGIYFAKLFAGNHVITRKLLLTH